MISCHVMIVEWVLLRDSVLITDLSPELKSPESIS
jgi:hypothetical protein